MEQSLSLEHRETPTLAEGDKDRMQKYCIDGLQFNGDGGVEELVKKMLGHSPSFLDLLRHIDENGEHKGFARIVDIDEATQLECKRM